MVNNEEGIWVDPDAPGVLSSKVEEQDDQIFEKARRINCVHFKNIVAEDFFKCLLGMHSVDKSPNYDVISASSFCLS